MMCAFNHLSNAGSSLIFLIFISKVRSSRVIDSDVMAVRSSMCVTSRLNQSVLQPGIYSVCFVFLEKLLPTSLPEQQKAILLMMLRP